MPRGFPDCGDDIRGDQGVYVADAGNEHSLCCRKSIGSPMPSFGVAPPTTHTGSAVSVHRRTGTRGAPSQAKGLGQLGHAEYLGSDARFERGHRRRGRGWNLTRSR